MGPASSTERFEVQVRSAFLLSLYVPRSKAVWFYCGFHITYTSFECFVEGQKMTSQYNDRNNNYYYKSRMYFANFNLKNWKIRIYSSMLTRNAYFIAMPA